MQGLFKQVGHKGSGDVQTQNILGIPQLGHLIYSPSQVTQLQSSTDLPQKLHVRSSFSFPLL